MSASDRADARRRDHLERGAWSGHWQLRSNERCGRLEAPAEKRGMPIGEVRPWHIRDLVLAMRKNGTIAPRSIRNVYGVLATMFRTAVADEVIASTPCVLARGTAARATWHPICRRRSTRRSPS
jgi:hypothetical protein